MDKKCLTCIYVDWLYPWCEGKNWVDCYYSFCLAAEPIPEDDRDGYFDGELEGSYG